jgi:hypothetical protein
LSFARIAVTAAKRRVGRRQFRARGSLLAFRRTDPGSERGRFNG